MKKVKLKYNIDKKMYLVDNISGGIEPAILESHSKYLPLDPINNHIIDLTNTTLLIYKKR